MKNVVVLSIVICCILISSHTAFAKDEAPEMKILDAMYYILLQIEGGVSFQEYKELGTLIQEIKNVSVHFSHENECFYDAVQSFVNNLNSAHTFYRRYYEMSTTNVPKSITDGVKNNIQNCWKNAYLSYDNAKECIGR